MSDIDLVTTATDTPSNEIPIPFDDVETSTSKPEYEYVSETLYIQNLNEKIRIDVLKASLRGLFKSYGEVVDVVAHNNLRMRGQAFVSFESADIAKKALKEVKGFPLYSKPMQISFARTRSDAVVKRLDAEHYEEHRQRRLQHKKATRYTNPLKQKFRTQRLANETDGPAVSAPRRPAVQMPDEYLPPNKILFLQNLPESVSKDQLMALFSQSILHRYPLEIFAHTHTRTGTPTCTKFVSLQTKKISRSSNIWTREAQLSRKMHYTTTSLMAKIRSRSRSQGSESRAGRDSCASIRRGFYCTMYFTLFT